MIDGHYPSREELKQMEREATLRRRERSQKIDNAVNAMIWQVFTAVISVLLLIGLLIMSFSPSKEGFVPLLIAFVVTVCAYLYSSKVKSDNKVED